MMKSKKKKTVYLILIIILAAAFLLQIVFEGVHEAGFYILFGFCGAWILILFAKRILAPILQRSEDYYEGGKDHD